MSTVAPAPPARSWWLPVSQPPPENARCLIGAPERQDRDVDGGRVR
jgi:hypothetical protein